MQEWVQVILGPGGALVLLAVISRGGFNFFTSMIKRQEEKFDRQMMRFDELHTSTIRSVQAQTDAIRKLTYHIESCRKK